MKITPTVPIPFGYTSIIKTSWRKGLMPSVKIGIYGGQLTPKNITIEHVLPISKGGKTTLSNIALATYSNNIKRGSKPLRWFLDMDIFEKYLKQFEDIEIMNFNGNKYIEALTKTIERILK